MKIKYLFNSTCMVAFLAVCPVLSAGTSAIEDIDLNLRGWLQQAHASEEERDRYGLENPPANLIAYYRQSIDSLNDRNQQRITVLKNYLRSYSPGCPLQSDVKEGLLSAIDNLPALVSEAAGMEYVSNNWRGVAESVTGAQLQQFPAGIDRYAALATIEYQAHTDMLHSLEASWRVWGIFLLGPKAQDEYEVRDNLAREGAGALKRRAEFENLRDRVRQDILTTCGLAQDYIRSCAKAHVLAICAVYLNLHKRQKTSDGCWAYNLKYPEYAKANFRCLRELNQQEGNPAVLEDLGIIV